MKTTRSGSHLFIFLAQTSDFNQRGFGPIGGLMSPLLKEAMKREQAFRAIETRKNDFTEDELKVNWLDGLGVVFVLISLFLILNFI